MSAQLVRHGDIISKLARPQPLQLDEVDLDELIADCATRLAPLFEERNVELVVQKSDVSEIRADERMLRQALLNLIRNAAEAIPEGPTDRRVTVIGSSEHDQAGKHWALVEIKDTGEGIPAADLQRIFIPFFTTKATGHGVGLALAHRVVTQHGGALTAANAKAGGAVFTVRLPV